jgi:hypothetical protein
LEHVLRAAGAIAGVRELIVLGSQSLLGAHPDAPAALCSSLEVDLYPLDDPAKADLIDGSIGELSPFHDTFGYYAHGVGPETATLPAGWRERLVAVQNQNTLGVTGLCLHPGDLAISKLVAGRPKDTDFVRTMLQHQIISREEIERLLEELIPADADLVRERLKAFR